MIDNDYKPEWHNADAIIAEAMELLSADWPFLYLAENHLPDDDMWCHNCRDMVSTIWKVLPRYHTDRDALAEALSWTAKDDGLWELIDDCIMGALLDEPDTRARFEVIDQCNPHLSIAKQYRRAYLIAPPHLIAGALAKVLAKAIAL